MGEALRRSSQSRDFEHPYNRTAVLEERYAASGILKVVTEYTGASIQPDQAWRTFDEWKNSRREIGVIFYSGSGASLYAMGFVDSARNGKLLLKSETTRVAFNLRGANFTFGPVQTWPRWPSPPIVEVIAVQVQLENGDWLTLAEGLRPESLPQAVLPE